MNQSIIGYNLFLSFSVEHDNVAWHARDSRSFGLFYKSVSENEVSIMLIEDGSVKQVFSRPVTNGLKSALSNFLVIFFSLPDFAGKRIFISDEKNLIGHREVQIILNRTEVARVQN